METVHRLEIKYADSTYYNQDPDTPISFYPFHKRVRPRAHALIIPFSWGRGVAVGGVSLISSSLVGG